VGGRPGRWRCWRRPLPPCPRGSNPDRIPPSPSNRSAQRTIGMPSPLKNLVVTMSACPPTAHKSYSEEYMDLGAMPVAAERLSDHCPVVVEIQDRDLD